MQQKTRCYVLAGTTAVLGILGAVVRNYYFKNAVDARGFLVPGHPAEILYWGIAGILVLTALCFSLPAPKVKRCPPDGMRNGLVQVVMAMYMALTAMNMKEDMHLYGLLLILAIAAAALLLVDGICRCMKKKMGILPHGFLCLFMITYSVSMYSSWSNVPEIERILVPAVAIISLIPFSYEMAAWDHKMNSDFLLLLMGAIAGFFCISAIGGPNLEPLHLSGGLWALNAIISLDGEEEA